MFIWKYFGSNKNHLHRYLSFQEWFSCFINAAVFNVHFYCRRVSVWKNKILNYHYPNVHVWIFEIDSVNCLLNIITPLPLQKPSRALVGRLSSMGGVRSTSTEPHWSPSAVHPSVLPGGAHAPHAKSVREAGAVAPLLTGHFTWTFVLLSSHGNYRRFCSDDLNETCCCVGN